MDLKYIDLEIKDRLGYIWLNRAPYNDFDDEFLDEIIQAHHYMAAKDDAWGVLLCSRNEKYFSNGMEPDYLLQKDVEGRAAVFAKLFELMKVMYSFPKVEASVITGHAMAGGAVLGIVTDFRFMGNGKYRYSFSEVRVGLTIPPGLLAIIESVVGPENLVRVAMLAEAFKPEEALSIGLVDRVFEHEKTLELSEKTMRSLLEMPQKSMRSVKKTIRQKYLQSLDSLAGDQLNFFKNFLEGNLVEGLTAVKERRRPQFQNP